MSFPLIAIRSQIYASNRTNWYVQRREGASRGLLSNVVVCSTCWMHSQGVAHINIILCDDSPSNTTLEQLILYTKRQHTMEQGITKADCTRQRHGKLPLRSAATRKSHIEICSHIFSVWLLIIMCDTRSVKLQHHNMSSCSAFHPCIIIPLRFPLLPLESTRWLYTSLIRVDQGVEVSEE